MRSRAPLQPSLSYNICHREMMIMREAKEGGLDTSETAALGDEIREAMAQIGSGQASGLDVVHIGWMMNRRVDTLYAHGLSVARARASRDAGN